MKLGICFFFKHIQIKYKKKKNIISVYKMSTFTLQNIGTIQMTESTNSITGACISTVGGGVSVDGYIVATGGVSAGNIQISDNKIKTAGNTGGDISFANDNLSTTGTVDFSGGVSLRGGVSINQFTFPSGLAPVADRIFVTDGNGLISLTTNGGGGGGGGATDINGLTDAFADATNVVLGVSPQNISGTDNVGVGVSALNAITSGNRNIALGFDALISGTTVNDNIAIGDHSLRAATTISSRNVGIGTSTLAKIASGTSQNVAVGYIAGQEITTGYQNTIVGASAGITLTTGQNNVILGYGAEPASAGSNNNVYLGNTSMSNLYFSGAIIATSDARDKTDVEDSTYGVEFIDRLRPVEYTWNRRHLQPGDDNDNINGKRRVGLIAQELLEIMPDNENEVLNLVNEDNPERYHVGYNNLIPVLVKAVKDLKAEVDALKQRMDACSC